MKKVTFTLVATAIALFANAQQPAGDKCATTGTTKEELAKNPAMALQHAQFLYDLQNYLAANPQLTKAEKSGEPRIIPVVFHIIYEGTSENISKAQVEDQVRIMNEDFRRLNADASSTPPAFDSVAVDCNIEFRLANLDPEGKCTDGITRTFSTRTSGASNQNGVKDVIYWNRDNYLNIWVVKSIGALSNLGTVLGYAQFPLGGPTSTDGVVILSSWIGSIGTSTHRGRTATHEVGHWLGLRHIWGDEDCGTDLIFDTPVHKEANFGCFTYPKFNTCADGDTVRGEMFMNYMDYSDDYCMNMFSRGQKAVMDFVLEGPENGLIEGFREHIWSPENHVATGVLNNPPVACAPIADFFGNKTMLCQGSTVNYTDNSYNGTVQSRQWTFEGANNPSSTSASPTATYATPGRYDVTLDVNNSQGSSTKTVNDYVIVSSNTADDVNYGYFESFEGEDWFNNKWIVFDEDNSGHKWQRIIGAASDMFHSAYVNNFDNIQGSVETLITPSYDLTTVSSPVLTFKYSGATRDTSLNDVLKIWYSLNCGQSWTIRATINGPELANAGLYTGAYLPPNVNVWNTKTVTLPSNVTNQDNVRFKFELTSGGFGSNNLFIDQINIANVSAINDNITDVVGLSIFPNPLGDNSVATLNFHMVQAGMVKVDVVDMLGRVVATVHNGQMQAGKQNIAIDRSTFGADGVYFVRFNVDGKQAIKKIIVAKQ